VFDVPDCDKLGFAMPAKEFIELDDLDAVDTALDGEIVTVDRHKTFYGSEEITYEEPGGSLVTFAKFTRES
jgi:hypothetical protein